MKKVFTNSNQVKCVFTDGGITFCGPTQEVYMPYGCIDSIHVSLLGLLQAVHHTMICSFSVDHKDKAELKKMVKYAQEAMKTAPKEEMKVIDVTRGSAAGQVSADLSPEEQLKQYKQLFIQGAISKDEYDAKKRLLK